MSPVKKLVIATRNPAKVDYYRKLFVRVIDQIVCLSDLGIEGKPTEAGETAEQNAEIKASFYSQKTDLPVFCEDEALYAHFLPPEKQPGTHVRRVNGVDEVSDDELFTYWESVIKDVPENARTGHWHIAYCLAIRGKTVTVSRDHQILFFYPTSKTRIPGWPMSSLEGSIKLRKPNSERTEEEKSQARYEEAPAIIEKLEELLSLSKGDSV